ncbi:MAG: enoyl-CoA hydratase-related protein [Castellaniella sp.]|uniref:enoyl-CoA hydratase-related protein n=1 Tax=Castellaniella sp. TaxID=1955812 RepID=UPI003C76F176
MSQPAAPILFDQRGLVAVLTLNRPAMRNALDGDDLFSAFETLFQRINDDLGIRAVVLTGAGTAFCSGGNVAEMRNRQGMFAGSPEAIAANPPQALRWTKQLLQQSHDVSLDEALDQAGQMQGLAHQTADHAEAVASFFEKRPAVFLGR